MMNCGKAPQVFIWFDDQRSTLQHTTRDTNAKL